MTLLASETTVIAIFVPIGNSRRSTRAEKGAESDSEVNVVT